MTPQTKLCELSDVYALGGLDASEQRAFEEHLKTCPHCQAELEENAAVAEWLLYDFEDVEPNEGMKERIFTNIFAEEKTDKAPLEPTQPEHAPKAPVVPFAAKRRRSFVPWFSGVAAVIVVAAVVVGISTTSHQRAIPGTILSTGTLTSLSENGQAKMYLTDMNGKDAMVVQFAHLKPTTGTQVYQVWFINQAGEPVSAGSFTLAKAGSWVFASPVPSGSYHTIAVTLEPNAGNTVPKGTKQFVATF